MLTDEKIEFKISECISALLDPELKPSDEKRLTERVRTLRELRIYLETKPQEAHLRLSLTAAENKLQKIDDGFTTWLRNTPDSDKSKNPLQQYRTLQKRKELLVQIANLKTLLEIE